MVGRRICVFGVTGSGKSTLARRLGHQLGVPVIELDAIRHDGGWDATPIEVMRARVSATIASATTGWVCEGNYRKIRDITLAQADTVVWLRLPWRTSFTRLLRRTIGRAWSGTPLYSANGPQESWRLSFASRESILWWAIHHHRGSIRSVGGSIAQLGPDVEVHVLRTPAEVERFLATSR